jgi:bisphosphoglycerate-dependent phosphoglycerate mutase
MVLILVRHGKSLWNLENRFTGFKDIGLCDEGVIEAQNCAKIIQNKKIKIDICYSSDLIRTIETSTIIKTNLKQDYPLNTSINLRERDYGDLTGQNKDNIKEIYGEKQLKKWRRSYYDRPLNGENLDDVVKRVGIFFDKNIFHLLNENKNVLIVAHGNSLRALMVYLKEKDIKNIEDFEFKTGEPYFFYKEFYDFRASQILDSRGFPTIQVKCYKNNELLGIGSTPSGASCGSNEALELRDNNKEIYNGKSVYKNINYINNDFSYKFKVNKIYDLIDCDSKLQELDNSPQKNIIGGNTTTALSFCFAHSGANFLNIELFEHFKNVYNNHNDFFIPTPMVNILNGGKHAGGKLKIQEFMIVPNELFNIHQQIQSICEIYYILQKILIKKYGIQSKNVGDEGGFTPNLTTPDEAIEVIIQAIQEANYIPNKDIFIALDCASSEFYDKNT